MPPDELTSTEARVIHATLAGLTLAVNQQGRSLESIDRAMHTLTRMEQDHKYIQEHQRGSAETLLKHDGRLQVIERDMPGLRELRKWVVAGILAGLGMMGLALVKLVIYDVPRFIPSSSTVSVPEDK